MATQNAVNKNSRILHDCKTRQIKISDRRYSEYMYFMWKSLLYIVSRVFLLNFPIPRAFYYHFEVQTKHETILYKFRYTKTIAQLVN